MSEHVSITEYRNIPGFAGYRVGSDGTVQSQWGRGSDMKWPKDWIKLRPIFNSDGYYQVVLYRSSRERFRRCIHRLVLEAFIGPRPQGMIARHLNGDKYDNRRENLTWGTPAENSRDMVAHGRSIRGERCNKAKMTEAQVREIRNRVGEAAFDLAKEFNVRPATIWNIRTRKTWAWLP